MKLVIVESPAKAKSIGKYLGADYKVLASYGHVRDLPSKNHSVRPDEDFALTWEVIEKAERALKEIRTAVKGADELILATDPDREGEAISWHVLEYLKSINMLNKVAVKRVAFNAVTKTAVLEALKSPRDINQELVEAYLARLSLDYLVGFTLSPILWRKLPGSRSAGRVQSVSLRLIVEREREIEVFKTQEYWSIEGIFGLSTKAFFSARLTHLKGKKLEKFSLQKEAEAKAAVAEALKCTYHVASIEKKRVKRNPQPPFTTSTLQQEASRKLGLSASKTMQIAQKLYEGIDLKGETTGLITYMRTDSVQVIPEAIKECQEHIRKEFGAPYLPPETRIYKTKAKNAQEAHEAIRPTDFSNRPQDLKNVLDPMQLRLYDLIWKRAVASQMSSAEFDQVGVDIASLDSKIIFRATGSTLHFDGFLKLYQESTDETEGADDGDDKTLPPLEKDQSLLCKEILPYQHFTQPPPRYTEASLVKKMEELGIGRPSTYARILQVLQDRDYVTVEKKQMIPQERGRIVTAFLTHFFERYVQYGFTADLENQLDDISAGSVPWKKVLHAFWETFSQTVKESQNLTISQVLETLEKDLAAYLFPEKEGVEAESTPICPRCEKGKLGLRLGKFGAFIGCSHYPDCAFTRPLQGTGESPSAGDLEESAQASVFPSILGTDPTSGLVISLRLGPYGPYFQWGDDPKPKRVSLPKGTPVESVTLERAIEMGKLPRDVGIHPETGEKITANLGRFGPYVKHKDRFISLKKDDDLMTITLERAVELIDKAPPPKAVKFTPPSKKGKKAEKPTAKEKKPRAQKKAG